MKPLVKIKGLQPVKEDFPYDKVRNMVLRAKEDLGEKPQVKDYLFKEYKL